jgi:hypothetical protein
MIIHLLKKTKWLLLALFILIGVKTSNATHALGSEINWKALGNHRYEFTVKTYRDCRGISSPGSRTLSFECISGTTGSANVSFSRQSLRNISPSCIYSTSPCNPPNTFGTGLGVEEHVYSAIVDFNSGQLKSLRDAGCCRFRFSYSECCRNNSLTNIPASNFYIDAEMDLCNIDSSSLAGRDNSPEFLTPPIAFACCTQPFNFSNGTFEADGDSIVFSMVSALTNPNQNANYISPFNPTTWPMTGYCAASSPCACNASTNLIQGFCFDSKTGNFSFVPVDCNESGAIVFKVDQWRKKAGTQQWIYIGFVKRDIQIWNIQCP